MLAFILANKLAIVTFLFGLSEFLSIFPGIKANGVYQMLANAIKGLKDQLVPPAQG